MEHVCAKKGSKIYHIQQYISIPLYYFTHCSLTNKVYENIQQAGFETVDFDVFEADELVYYKSVLGFLFAWLLNLVKTHASGVATKPQI